MTEILKIEGTIKRSQSIRQTFENDISKEIKKYWDDKNGGQPPVDTLNMTKQIKRKDLLQINLIKSEEDIEKLVNDISKKLKAMLNDNHNIEFID